jgi:hypothetical protein
VPHQEALTIVAKVDPQKVAELGPVLEQIGGDPAKNAVLPFGALRNCHFGRVLYLPAAADLQGRSIAPQLMMLSDCDGPANDHIEQVVDAAKDGVDALFGACEGYPAKPATRAARVAFLRKSSLKLDANYVHRQGRTVEQIQREAQLRTALQEVLGERGFGSIPAVEVRKRLVAFVRNDARWDWALEPPPSIDLGYRVRNAFDLATLPFGLVALGPIVLPLAAAVVALVRLAELRDPAEHIRPSAEHVKRLADLEDFVAHNGFTAGGYVKPGLLRQVVLRSVLPLIGWGTRHLFTRDSLAGVKSIHFARWIPLDGGRRVVFASNYDGSLENYNNDFIDLVSWGLNLVFSNGFGYPKTSWLVFGGATREQEFKDYLRRHQIPTPAWYSAYPHLTALQIERNAAIRAGLSGRMNEREAQRWLRLF